jgi:phospholipid-binding lipoprotein MlaA
MTLSRFLLVLLMALSPLALQASDKEHSNDPFESVNRQIFAFNEGLDEHVLKPVAKGYRLVTPDPLQRGVSNFIANIYEFNSILNSILQGRAADTLHTTARFFVNTTVGLGGFFDVASSMGVDRRPADFGQTLAAWGVGEGPFLMLPLLGPKTLRSGAGAVVDIYSGIPFLVDDSVVQSGFTTVETIDIRVQLLKTDELLSGDRYIFTRDAYRQYREYFNSHGEVDDTFSDYEAEDDYEDF